jgi:hypothetical protein
MDITAAATGIEETTWKGILLAKDGTTLQVIVLVVSNMLRQIITGVTVVSILVTEEVVTETLTRDTAMTPSEEEGLILIVGKVRITIGVTIIIIAEIDISLVQDYDN